MNTIKSVAFNAFADLISIEILIMSDNPLLCISHIGDPRPVHTDCIACVSETETYMFLGADTDPSSSIGSCCIVDDDVSASGSECVSLSPTTQSPTQMTHAPTTTPTRTPTRAPTISPSTHVVCDPFVVPGGGSIYACTGLLLTSANVGFSLDTTEMYVWRLYACDKRKHMCMQHKHMCAQHKHMWGTCVCISRVRCVCFWVADIWI